MVRQPVNGDTVQVVGADGSAGEVGDMKQIRGMPIVRRAKADEQVGARARARTDS